MENYALLALIIIVFWIAGFTVYLLTSNRQIVIEDEIDEISGMLDSSVVEETTD